MSELEPVTELIPTKAKDEFRRLRLVTNAVNWLLGGEDFATAEDATGVKPKNRVYPFGHLLRYAERNAASYSSALSDACTVAASLGCFVYIPEGDYDCATDVPAIHTVQLRGPGSITIGTGRPWWAEPDETNSTFSVPMTLYVSASGSNSNSGLAAEFPLATLQKAADILDLYRAPLVGFWRIILAAGTYTSGATFFGMQNTYENPLYIAGPSVTAWSKASPPANRAATGGSIPTAIFDSTGSGSGWAISAHGGSHILVQDVKFTDWGTEATDADDGALRAKDWSSIRCKNCHVWDSTNATMGRENSYVIVDGGYFNGCRRYLFAIMSRYQTAIGADSAGDNDAELVEGCTFGVDVWEGGNGHADYTHFLDCGTSVYVRKGGHCSMIGPTFERTTGTLVGVQVQDGGNINLDGNEVWTGTFTPRIKQFNFGCDVRETAYPWRSVDWESADASTSGTTETTFATYTMPRGMFVYVPAAFRVHLVGSINNPNDAVTIRIRAGGTLIGNISFALSANPLDLDATFDVRAIDATNQKYWIHGKRHNSIGTGNIFDDAHGTGTIDFGAADRDITVTIQCANASDSATVTYCEIERRG